MAAKKNTPKRGKNLTAKKLCTLTMLGSRVRFYTCTRITAQEDGTVKQESWIELVGQENMDLVDNFDEPQEPDPPPRTSFPPEVRVTVKYKEPVDPPYVDQTGRNWNRSRLN